MRFYLNNHRPMHCHQFFKKCFHYHRDGYHITLQYQVNINKPNANALDSATEKWMTNHNIYLRAMFCKFSGKIIIISDGITRAEIQMDQLITGSVNQHANVCCSLQMPLLIYKPNSKQQINFKENKTIGCCRDTACHSINIITLCITL